MVGIVVASACVPRCRKLGRTVNGPVLEWLARQCGYSDLDALLRFSTDFIHFAVAWSWGRPCAFHSLAGTALYDDDTMPVRGSYGNCNHELISSLREDPHASELLRLTWDDHAKGRMSAPVSAKDVDLDKVCRHVAVVSVVFVPHTFVAGPFGAAFCCGPGLAPKRRR